MKKNKPGIFNNQNGTQDLNNPEIKIKELRDLARNYRDQNNILVSQVWDINMKLAKDPDDTIKTKLLADRKELEEKIIKEAYQEKFNELIEQIRSMEMAIQGHSDLNNSVFDL